MRKKHLYRDNKCRMFSEEALKDEDSDAKAAA
jgi:hypothetical protein